MEQPFRKFLCLSTETSRLPREEFRLDRISWRDISSMENLSDYDHVLINLTALAQIENEHRLAGVERAFDFDSWADILAASGSIFLVGDPDFGTPDIATGAETRGRALLRHLVYYEKDNRALEYRRVKRPKEHSPIYRYLDSVLDWKYSWKHLEAGKALTQTLSRKSIHSYAWSYQLLGTTSYSTSLACEFSWVQVHAPRLTTDGQVTVLPPSGRGTDVEDLFVLQNCFGIATTLEEPKWVAKLKLPHQAEVEQQIVNKQETATNLEREITEHQAKLVTCKRWYRLLYDDGESLEAIVKEGFELLGASVNKVSKVKDDYRLKVSGHPEAVMEVKGTQNAKFGRGALRQLAGWMDEVNYHERITVKGICVGNASRNDEPQTRKVLFEKEVEEYAIMRDIVILRAMDLFCLTVLKNLDLLDTAEFWNEFFNCKGAFDATKFWNVLPVGFRLPADSKPEPNPN